MIDILKKEWITDPKTNILAGIVVALALIPEAIAFSIIAGVDPMVGLYASFIIAVSISILGGRPAMISAATGAIALLVTPLVSEYGVEYLLAATLLMGLIQLILGILKIGKLMKFIPKSVMLGFVNALAVMIFTSQIEHIFGISISTYVYVGVTLLIVYLVPRFFKAVPAPLIAIVLLTAIYLFMGAEVRTVGDLGAIERSLPSFIIPDVPYTLETLRIILPFSISMAIVGLVESLLTAKIVDDATDSYSSKNRESRGQGISNIIASFFGGMGGCAMIGQSIINVRSGATTRLSTFTAGTVLIFLIIVLGDLVVQVPMPILAGIMVMVAIGTFDWGSFKYMVRAPRTDAIVMVVTVAIVLMTHNLAIGVIAGVILSALFFATKISNVEVEKTKTDDAVNYRFNGQVFFASVDTMMNQIDLDEENKAIELDFTNAHIWDDSGVDAIDTMISKLKRKGNRVSIRNLNKDSRKIINELSMINKEELI
ncbi:SulP family inorganic anion transporter [Salinicoccus cyprini]|uniref:SulP family inorganic anion transporter n=1 Tax=Salinicoccus cyprini TaxID=2493691 RepID=A0A558AV11_9STAP|nr:SulP family inorganic anion transporter [Salinicoccus cyprini]TVT28112.1 SulP family inorganic anion transporter [Salinicoccus cyprini]